MTFELEIDRSGFGTVARVVAVTETERTLIWSHASIEGPVPDVWEIVAAIDLWRSKIK